MNDHANNDKPWYVRAFAAEYIELYRHRSPEQGRDQVQQMLSSGLLPPTGQILDLCCGAGRHLLPMRDAGLNAIGLDLSRDLLEHGQMQGVAVRGNAIELPFADNSFDVITNLFSSFGYFPTDEMHMQVLHEMHRVLKPEGKLIIDHMNADVIIRELVPYSEETRGELILKQTRRYDADSKRVIKDVEYCIKDQEPRHWHESVRLFTPTELDEYIKASGLKTVSRFASLDAGSFSQQNSKRQVVVATS
ncbi:methyltransferase domain-containing protein [Planctomycetota bacterium]|nr:methyltransferase domain-containing protein [Planctomycetota bacterium]